MSNIQSSNHEHLQSRRRPSTEQLVAEANLMRGEALGGLALAAARAIRRAISKVGALLRNDRGGMVVSMNAMKRRRQGASAEGAGMDRNMQMVATADVAGAEYLAEAMSKQPTAVQRCEPRRDTHAQPTAVTSGVEYRAAASQHRWPGLLTWRCAA